MFKRGAAPLPLACAAMSFSGVRHAPGMNADCHWPAESARWLHLRSEDLHRHLMADARAAEELAIRYADRRHSRRPSRAQWRPAHDECLAKT